MLIKKLEIMLYILSSTFKCSLCCNIYTEYFSEREKRHFPWLNNKRSPPEYQLPQQGRRYIPHGYGDDFQFVPHPPFQEPEYTE